jgi:hypothetical protein
MALLDTEARRWRGQTRRAAPGPPNDPSAADVESVAQMVQVSVPMRSAGRDDDSCHVVPVQMK